MTKLPAGDVTASVDKVVVVDVIVVELSETKKVVWLLQCEFIFAFCMVFAPLRIYI